MLTRNDVTIVRTGVNQHGTARHLTVNGRNFVSSAVVWPEAKRCETAVFAADEDWEITSWSSLAVVHQELDHEAAIGRLLARLNREAGTVVSR